MTSLKDWLGRWLRQNWATHPRNELMDSIGQNVCPDCGGVGFFEGARGGACTNIECANPVCGSRFNVGPLYAERISQSPAKDRGAQ